MPSVTTKTTTRPPADAVDAVRRFNRFYTRRIHILDEAHLESDFSLAAVRVLYELAHRDAMSAADLGRELDLDAGYLSRILGDLGRRKLVTRQRATDDAREPHPPNGTRPRPLRRARCPRLRRHRRAARAAGRTVAAPPGCRHGRHHGHPRRRHVRSRIGAAIRSAVLAPHAPPRRPRMDGVAARRALRR